MARRNKVRATAGLLDRLICLVVSAGAIGFGFNRLSPSGVRLMANPATLIRGHAEEPGVRIISLDEARTLISGGKYIVLDARSHETFADGHIPGAISAPVSEAAQTLADLQVLLAPAQPILVYCSGETCDESLRLGRLVHDQGVREVAVFEGGMTRWRAAGLPVEKGE